jgi:hypothetical protein
LPRNKQAGKFEIKPEKSRDREREREWGRGKAVAILVTLLDIMLTVISKIQRFFTFLLLFW